MEVAIRWSPHHSTNNQHRFLIVDVANPSLTLNELDSSLPPNAKGKLTTYRPIAQYNKLPSFAAFDWSKTDESILALGLGNGSANLVKLRPSDEGGSETAATFRIKQQRKCNSLAFSTQDWLAVAVEKTRSDVCLFVYDTRRGGEASVEPIRRLCAAELVSSVRFFPSKPQEIVATTQKAFVKLFDLRDGFSGGGGGGGGGGGVANAQAPTKCVNNLAIDPMDENYFASAGSTDDPVVTVWDKRWMISASSSSSSAGSSTNSGAVFEFKPAVNNVVKTTVWSLRWSGERRGRLALGSSTGELKIIDMVEGSTSIFHNADNAPSMGSATWSCNRYVSETRILEHPYHDPQRGRDSKTRIAAYDWVSHLSTHDQPILALRPNREVDVLRVPYVKPIASITPRQDFSLSFRDISITEPRPFPEQARQTIKAPYEQVNGISPEDFGPWDYEGEEDVHQNGDTDKAIVCERNCARLGKLLASGTVQRSRCQRGYLFDCRKNMQIVAGNWQLERLWEIINRFREQAANDGMVHHHLDLSYVGISGLWSENIGSSPHRRLSHTPAKPSKAIVGLNATHEIPAFEGERTHFPEHRQLCLAVCGWKFTVETLEAECAELIDRGLHYQAIVQAVLHNYRNIALNLLRTLIRSKTIQNIGLGALLAADGLNAEQKEMCMWMAADTTDPALKALLTFLTTGDWRDVMKTNYLHLGYRLALGLKYLNDTELSGFIQSETARGVKNGDLEGILLTGLGEQAMDLFQTYITRTNDLQTAVLATAFTCPRYVHDDVRWELWRETYFAQMQGWRAVGMRAKFVVQYARMARTKEGRSLLPIPPAKAELRCLHCQGPLGRAAEAEGRGLGSGRVAGWGLSPQLSRSSNSNPLSSFSSSLGSPDAVRLPSSAAYEGTVCPSCGRHMPRCAVCLTWLGTPSPNHTHESTEKEKEGPQQAKVGDVMAKLLAFCVACGHGFHADHARLWFGKWDVCPVPDCGCACGIK